MSKLVTMLITAFLFTIVQLSQTQASSIFVSSMTLLSTKSFSSAKNDIERILRDQKEQVCMALGLYHEARGEPVIGQYAVGATILNRVRSSVYPDTVCGVVFQNQHMKNRCQFSFACDGRSDKPRNLESYTKMQSLAKTLLTNDITREAKFIGRFFQASVNDMTHYHRYDVYPHWSRKLVKLSQLGAHVFFKSTRVTKRYTF